MNTEKVSKEQFLNNLDLQKEFGGDYDKYVSSFNQMLKEASIYGVGRKFGIPGLSAISCFFGLNKVGKTDSEEDKRFEEITKKLEQIKDPKIREQVAAEMFAGNLSDAFFDMIMERYDKKKAEFEEIWAKYQEAKAKGEDLKKTCERLLAEYKRSNGDVTTKSNYNKAYNEYAATETNADILLTSARDVSHRAIG